MNLLIKPASGLCNMSCEYCFYCDTVKKRNKSSYGLMEERTLKNVIRKAVLSEKDICSIVFQGGEPTLRGLEFFRKAVTFVNQYNKHGIRIQYALQTNGYALTDEWCEFFVKHGFLIGLSVDGIQKTHNKYRYSKNDDSTYERIMQTVELFNRYQVEYNILTVVHRETAEYIKAIYADYKRRGFGYQQYITCLDPFGEQRGKQEYSLRPQEYGKFLIRLFDLWHKDLQKGQQPYIRQFENYIAILCGYVPEACEQQGVCGVQHVVEADGSVYPCDFYVLDAYCLGNLNTDSMAKLQEERQSIGFISRSNNHSNACVACEWHKLCRGGCFRSRDGEADNYFCKGYRMFFKECHERMKEVADLVMRRGRWK